MFEVTRFETRRRIGAATTRTVAVALYAAVVVLSLPVVLPASDALAAFAGSLPPAVVAAFGVARLDTAAGILAVQFYGIFVVFLLGLEVSYAASGAIADRIATGRVDFVLSGPVSRTRYLAGTFGSLLPESVAVAAVTFGVVAGGLGLVPGSVPLVELLVAHVLMVAYLAACVAVGLLAGVTVADPRRARRVATGALLCLFALDALTAGGSLAPLGWLSPTRHYDPTAVLVYGEVDPVGAGALVLTPVVLLAAATAVFTRREL